MLALLVGIAVFQPVMVTSSDACVQTLSGHFSKLQNLTPKQPANFYWHRNCSFYIAKSKLSNDLAGRDQLENNFLSPLLNMMQKSCQGGDEVLSCATKCVPYEPTEKVPKKLWKSVTIYKSNVHVTCGWLRGCTENEECFQVCADFNTNALENAQGTANQNCEPIKPNNEQEAFANANGFTETGSTTHVDAKSTSADATKNDFTEQPTNHGDATTTVDDENVEDVTSPNVEDANEVDNTSPTIEDANEEDVASSTAESANEVYVTSPNVEDANEVDNTSPTVEDANEDVAISTSESGSEVDVTSPNVEDANEVDNTSPTVKDANEDVASSTSESGSEVDVTSPNVENANEELASPNPENDKVPPISTSEDAIVNQDSDIREDYLANPKIKEAVSEVFKSRSPTSFMEACFIFTMACSFLVFMKQQ